MLTGYKIISIYCIVDDILKGIGYKEDLRRKVSDSEIITTVVVSVLYFGGHIDNERSFMKITGMVPAMLDKSRFSRRLHQLSDMLFVMFYSNWTLFKNSGRRIRICD